MLCTKWDEFGGTMLQLSWHNLTLNAELSQDEIALVTETGEAAHVKDRTTCAGRVGHGKGVW